MNFQEIVQGFEDLQKTSKRGQKTQIVAELLQKCSPQELREVILLLQGRVIPQNDTRNIGVSSQLLLKSIERAYGINQEKLNTMWKDLGDLGEVAAASSTNKKQQMLFSNELDTKKVIDNVKKLLEISGDRSVDQKVGLISQLLSNATPLESKYIARLILEVLRLGVGNGILRDALIECYYPPIQHIHGYVNSQRVLLIANESASTELPSVMKKVFTVNEAFENYPKKEFLVTNDETLSRQIYQAFIDSVELALHLTNDIAFVAVELAKGSDLREIKPIYHTPISVMLAQKVADVTDAFEHVKKPAMIEYKYDGFRVQIHKTKDNISLFTRKLESVTAAFPDVVQAIQQHVTADSCILDAEIVGYDPAKKTYLPFQQISSRIRRKYDISQNQKTTPVEVNVFDIIMLNQENLLNTPFGERRKLLQTYIEQKTLVCVISKGIITEDENAAKSFYAAALAAGLEGVMCKALDAPYKPGSRVGFMVKLKPTMDTLDVVVTAATWGEGKRANVLTSFTISCIDDDGNFLELGNVGTGFKELEKEVKPTDTTTQPEEENTDVTFSTMTKLLEPNVIKTDGRNVIVKPTVVLEVAYEEIQKSQNYSSGFALRFPRVVRLQNTRSADSISTLALVEEFYYGQAKRQ